MKRSQKTKKTNLKQVAFTRFMLVVAFFVLWIGGISVRLVHLQVTQHDWHREQAANKRQNIKRTRMLRGTIMDRNERALAMSLPAKTLYANPIEMPDPDSAAKTIAAALKLNSIDLATRFHEAKAASKQYVVIQRKVEEDAVQKINRTLDTPDLKKADLPYFPGLHWSDDQKRKYPYDTLAAQVVGYNDAADVGRAGIEQTQEGLLRGAIIDKVQERDRLGRVYDETVIERAAPADVVLTLDTRIQYITEQALESGVRAANAKAGMVVVMSVKTGEVLAIGNYPTFDPNKISEMAVENVSNKAVQSLYSPGSVFKVVTYGSALEKNLFSPEDQIDSGNGTIEVANHKFTDSHAIGRVSYSQAMAHSSNVCAIKTATRVGREDFFAMVQKMGFGARTGVELPAETSGIVRPLERWYGDSLASMSIGYEISVTALQMASAFATIANDGVKIQPHIIKEIRRSNDEARTVTKAQQTRVLTAKSARDLRTMLQQVVLAGTGRRAQLDGYTVAGKTGTAWKFNPKSKSIDRTKYVSSFIGMAPANNPEIVVAVVMDEPKTGARDGGGVAAPVFKEIAQQVLQEMKVKPDAPFREENLVAKDISEAPVPTVPQKNASNKESASLDRSDKSVKKSTGTDTKPAAKNVAPKEIKKNIEKKLNDVGKLTAAARPYFRHLKPVRKTKIET
ncbi:MAG: peptidoglycan D,D-transpeptidase FtsI family protein [Pyrinomonadaceae bacterium]